jgi:hypothetical protein
MTIDFLNPQSHTAEGSEVSDDCAPPNRPLMKCYGRDRDSPVDLHAPFGRFANQITGALNYAIAEG